MACLAPIPISSMLESMHPVDLPMRISPLGLLVPLSPLGVTMNSVNVLNETLSSTISLSKGALLMSAFESVLKLVFGSSLFLTMQQPYLH